MSTSTNSSTQIHFCPDCKEALNREVQIWKHKPEPTITYTCLTEGCALRGTTLNAQEWLSANLDSYRRMNAGKV